MKILQKEQSGQSQFWTKNLDKLLTSLEQWSIYSPLYENCDCAWSIVSLDEWSYISFHSFKQICFTIEEHDMNSRL